VLPVTAELATEAGRLFLETGRRSRSLPDCIIAAAAIRDQAALATVNRSAFEPFVAHGLTFV
jgi:predicted nucleic acid-binding protein